MTGPPAQGRDRDAAGRARSTRPRDRLGRPLSRQAAGEPVMPEDLALAPAEALELAQRLIDSGRPFHAHEVLEAAWRAAPDADRDLWQGLAQIAVGLTHARRGNGRGAAALLRRGGLRVAGNAAARPLGIDAAGLSHAAAQLARRVEAGGLAAVGEAELCLSLTGHQPPCDTAAPGGPAPGKRPGQPPATDQPPVTDGPRATGRPA